LGSDFRPERALRVVFLIRDEASLVIVLRIAARGAQPYRRLRR
jgi:hypothetical protein